MEFVRNGRYVAKKDFRFSGRPFSAGDRFDRRRVAISDRDFRRLVESGHLVLEEIYPTAEPDPEPVTTPDPEPEEQSAPEPEVAQVTNYEEPEIDNGTD